MKKIPMKKVLFTFDDHSLQMLDDCCRFLDSCPEEYPPWSRSRLLRALIYMKWKDIPPSFKTPFGAP